MIDFWKRVRAQMTGDLNQNWLAGEIGIAPNTLSAWITRNSEPKASYAQAIASALGVTVEFLVTGKEPYYDYSSIVAEPTYHYNTSEMQISAHKKISQPTEGEVLYIPIAEGKVSAGGGVDLLEENHKNFLPVLKKMVKHYPTETLCVVEVRGDSMTGVQLFNGDLVVFSKDCIEGDGIYVIAIDGQAFVKRLEFNPIDRTITIHSENSRYQSKTVTADVDRVTIQGKVIGWFHNHMY